MSKVVKYCVEFTEVNSRWSSFKYRAVLLENNKVVDQFHSDFCSFEHNYNTPTDDFLLSQAKEYLRDELKKCVPFLKNEEFTLEEDEVYCNEFHKASNSVDYSSNYYGNCCE